MGLLALIGTGVTLAMSRSGAPALKQLLYWGAAGLATAVLLTYRAPLTSFVAALELPLATTAPGPTPEAGPGAEPGTVSLKAEANGHFAADALVDGTHVFFIVDTGATDVVLKRSDAERLGIDLKALRYDASVRTHNGDTPIAFVELDEIVIGSIRVERVTAIVPMDEFTYSLLGMSFLRRLSGFSVDSDRLVMRQ
jgi:aspartyl protease family protein